MGNAKRDQNNTPSILGVSSVDGVTPVVIQADPVTGAMKIQLIGGASGTVQSVSSANADIAVTDPTVNPILTLNSSITGGASKIAKQNTSGNLASNNHINGFATTVTAAGTTTLTVSSAAIQEFTGTSAQTVVLPVVSTLILGQTYRIINNSTSGLILNSSGGNAVAVVASGVIIDATCVLLTGTSAASWDVIYQVNSMGGGVAAFLAAPTSANLKTVMLDETGSGALVFGTSPSISGALINGATFTGTVTVPTAVSSTDAVNKNDLDNAVAGSRWKDPVRVATTANGVLATAFAAGQTIDGVVLANRDRILIKNQTTATENGIYFANTSGAPTRALDADTGAELVSASVFVSEGTVNSDIAFNCNNNSITIGSTNITFVQFTGGGGLTAGNGVNFTGNLISIDTAITIDKTTAQTFSSGIKTFLSGIFALRNVANTFSGFFTNTNTADRTYTLKDANGTIAFTSDITGTNSGTNTGDETAARIATINHGTAAKTTLVDADEITGQDSANTFSLIRTTWTNVKVFLKTYFDTLYMVLVTPGTSGNVLTSNGTIWLSSAPASPTLLVACSVGTTGLALNTGGSDVKVTLGTEDFDISNNFDSTTNYRFTAPSTGYYEISGYGEITSASTGQNCNLKIYKNGSAFKTMTGTFAGASYRTILSGRFILSLAANDTIELYATQASSGNTATLQIANLTINKM